MSRLSARDTARLARVVNRTERTPLAGGVPNRPSRSNTATIPKRLVYIAGTIDGRTSVGSTAIIPGSGAATLCVRTANGWSRTGGSIPVHNTSNRDVTGPTYCQVGWIDGRWVIDVADCSGGA